jgi:hypothetical protein
MQRSGIGLRENGDGRDIQIPARAYYPQGNLTAIGNQYFFERASVVRSHLSVVCGCEFVAPKVEHKQLATDN